MTQASDTAPPKRFRETTTARLARARLSRQIQGLTDDAGIWWKVQRVAPEAWATLAEDLPCEEPRVKITIRLDASVARFYRAMGTGYQARMNRVLATYAQMQIGEVERERASVFQDLEQYGIEFPPEVGETWRKYRHVLPDDAPIDLEKIDRYFGVEKG